MVSRTAKDWTGDFPALARALALLPVDAAWLDGEVVALDAHGRTSFQALQNALSAKDSRDLKYLAFDLLYLNGFDLRGVVLTERKRLLRVLSSAPKRSSTASISPLREPAFLQNVGTSGSKAWFPSAPTCPIAPAAGQRGRKSSACSGRNW